MKAKKMAIRILYLCMLSVVILAGCKVSGRITENGTPIAGVTVKISGDNIASTTTDSNGEYSFTVFKGTFTVTPVPVAGDTFFPLAKQVFVKAYKKATVNFTSLADGNAYWEPSIVVPIQAYPEVRGKKVMRGLIHLHSIYSHDACDNQPWIDGKPNKECLCQLREAICNTNQQFVMMSDHPDNFAYHEFPDVLLYQPESGDELIYKDGRPVANVIDCGYGNKTILTTGTESDLMPLSLDGMPDGTVQQRLNLLGSSTAGAVDKLRELGAMVFVTHPESWKTEDLLNLPIDGIDVYNLHANIDPGIRQDYLGLPSLGFIPDLLNMLFPSWNNADPDLFLLSFLTEIQPDIKHWDRLLNYRQTVGILATDAHRNSLPFNLPDGDRADSYRRMMKWFANYVLISHQTLEEIEDAVVKGRMYGAFQAFGEPVGFEYYAETMAGTYEMGDEVSISEYPVLHVKLPSFYRMDPSLEKPEMIVTIIKAGEEGGTPVAQSIDEDIIFSPDDAGAYRAEIKIIPYHLKKWLGDKPGAFMKEYPLIYANAIFVK